MVDQPAYLKALKAYARVQYGDDSMAESVLAELRDESDRGAVILAATSIEDMLEFSIGLRMTPLETDATARAEVFGARGTLSSYANKTLIAYALGIIDKSTKKEIDLIREIRNACAHSRLPISFKVRQLQDAAKAVIGKDLLKEIKDHEPQTLRTAFIIQCSLIAKYIGTGQRQTPLEAYEEEMRSRGAGAA